MGESSDNATFYSGLALFECLELQFVLNLIVGKVAYKFELLSNALALFGTRVSYRMILCNGTVRHLERFLAS